jgi:hypothetical protein
LSSSMKSVGFSGEMGVVVVVVVVMVDKFWGGDGDEVSKIVVGSLRMVDVLPGNHIVCRHWRSRSPLFIGEKRDWFRVCLGKQGEGERDKQFDRAWPNGWLPHYL